MTFDVLSKIRIQKDVSVITLKKTAMKWLIVISIPRNEIYSF